MYKEGEYVVYKRDVCKIREVKKNHLQGRDYYLLNPILDESLKIEIPVDSNCLRDLISKKEIEEFIKEIPDIQEINVNNRMIDNEYKALMNSGNHKDLIRIIKTTYARNKERTDNKKKTGDKDNNYFRIAERYLYSEFSIVLGLSYDETKEYVTREVAKIV